MVKGSGGRNSQQVGQGQARHAASRRQAEGVLVVVAINLEMTSKGLLRSCIAALALRQSLFFADESEQMLC